MKLELSEDMLKSLALEYEENRTTSNISRDNIGSILSMDTDKNFEVNADEEKVHEIKVNKGTIYKTKTEQEKKTKDFNYVVKLNNQNSHRKHVNDMEISSKSKKEASIAQLYNKGIKQYKGSVVCRQNHFRVKSFVITDEARKEYRKAHHSQLKKTYVEQAIGDTDSTVSLTPNIIDEKNKVQKRVKEQIKESKEI